MHTNVFDRAVAAIDAQLKTEKRLIVAIDGRCGSGKTTLAAQLRAHYGCAVIPMDQFFLRPEQRTPQRLAAPGENVDHERFLEEVLQPLSRGAEFSYRPFECSRMALGGPIAVTSGRLTVVEGSYSCHPKLRGYYGLRIFLTVDPAEQLRRITARSPAKAEMFRQKWIPLEEAYFAAYDLENTCDLLLSTQKSGN